MGKSVFSCPVIRRLFVVSFVLLALVQQPFVAVAGSASDLPETHATHSDTGHTMPENNKHDCCQQHSSCDNCFMSCGFVMVMERNAWAGLKPPLMFAHHKTYFTAVFWKPSVPPPIA